MSEKVCSIAIKFLTLLLMKFEDIFKSVMPESLAASINKVTDPGEKLLKSL